jgi:hypothetical protein
MPQVGATGIGRQGKHALDVFYCFIINIKGKGKVSLCLTD